MVCLGAGVRWGQEQTEDVSGGEGVTVGREELSQAGKVITGRHEGEFRGTIGADLREADDGREGVADAFAAEGFVGGATFAPIVFEGFGGATVTDGTVGLAIEVAQVAEVTDARACVVVDWV